MPLIIQSVDEADGLLKSIWGAAARMQAWIAKQTGDPLDLLHSMKFEPVGFHPLENRPLNLIEQVNQTWTFIVAIEAARQLLSLHPNAGHLKLAPGAHRSQDLDIMSENPGYLGAETFAAVDPQNNRKLAADLAKLLTRSEQHRYVFFMSPRFPDNRRLPQFEREGIQVWSVDIRGGRLARS